MTTTSYRLPRHFLPSDYDVQIDATPKRTSFSGRVIVTGKLMSPSTTLELHALELKVGKAVAKAGSKSFPAQVKAKKDRETVELVFKKPLPKGKVALTLDFQGKLNPSMHGLYLAVDGPEKAIASQCEATDARRIFPCADEPDLKATLKWTVTTDPELTVITNGVFEKASKTRVLGKAKVKHTFKRTRIIPTYLAAITIGALEATKVKRIAGIPCRIACGVGKLELTGFAEEVTARVLPWFQDYFGQKYNYQKLDQVAVPGFDAGAMENVGAIFYRQNLLLMKPGQTSWQAQKRIAEVIAHEIAHQWFGNLVTMKWWDDLWLNEAFATWIAYKAVDLWQPSFRMWDEYLESKSSALEADALVSTHPIYTDVKSPAEATELFDVITYEKGCAVLRMCESYLGDDVFRDGIRRYQVAFKNKNARGADLWQKLEEASREPVGELMQSWVTQEGFPLLTASLKKNGGKVEVTLSQRRFYASKAELERGSEQRWAVPVVLRYATKDGSRTHRVLLRDETASFVLPSDATGAWVYPNDNASGFYRTQLSAEMRKSLLSSGLQELSPGSRMSLLDDEWALVRAGLSDITTFLDVVAAFSQERDYVVLRTLSSKLGYLDQRLVADSERPAYRAFVKELLGAQQREAGFAHKEGEPEASRVRRALLASALGEVARDEEVLARAIEKMEEERKDPAAVDANLAGTVAVLGALHGDDKRLASYVDTFTQRKKERAAPELQLRYLSALAYFEDPKLVSKVFTMCLDETVPQEQLRSVLSTMLSRRATQRATWSFLKSHWKTLAPKVGLMGISRLVETTGALPFELYEDVRDFFAKNPVDEAKRALQKALEAMQLKNDLVTREGANLAAWLRRRAA